MASIRPMEHANSRRPLVTPAVHTAALAAASSRGHSNAGAAL